MSDRTLGFGAGPRKDKDVGGLGIGTSANHTMLILVCGTALEKNVSSFLHANNHPASHLAIHAMRSTVMCVQNSTARAPWRMRPCQLPHSKPSPHLSLPLLPCSAPFVLPRHPMLRKPHRLPPGLSSKSVRTGLGHPPKLPAMPGHLRPDPRILSALPSQPVRAPRLLICNHHLGHLNRHRNSPDRPVDSGSTLHSLPKAA